MGACLSVSPHSAAALPSLESTLQTGDIILLLDGSKSSKYLIKAGLVGGWTRASKVGFLVREQHQNSDDGGDLHFYHADEAISTAPGMTRIVGRPLTDELNNSTYRLAIVRRLRTPLSTEKMTLIRDFVALNTGAIIPEQHRPCSVLMASSFSSPTTQAFEHLECSDFVMMMLHLVGLVEPTQNPFEYVATDPRGRLLLPPTTIKLKTAPTTTISDYQLAQQRAFQQLELDSLPSVVETRISSSSRTTSSGGGGGDRSNHSSSTTAATSPTSVVAAASSRSLSKLKPNVEAGGSRNSSAPATPTKKTNARSATTVATAVVAVA